MATLVREEVKPGRVLSLDVVRGIVIAFMILVNDPGSGRDSYTQLEHAKWNGWTLTDLVFPSFLLMAGVAVVFATEARLARGETKKTLMLHALYRSIVLFCFGLIVNAFPFFHLDSWRIYGVLQRIAICYLVMSIAYLLSKRAVVFVAITVVSIVSYYVIMRWIPVPGYGMPGRDLPLLDMDNNWVAIIDRAIMPAARLYQKVRDPEGLLSTLPALGTAALGVLTGLWLRSARSGMAKAGGLLAGAVSGIVLGEIWNIGFPINKKLWTSSYVLFAAGCTLLLLAICYFVFDVKKVRKEWAYPALVFGANAITAYVVSELLAAAIGSIRFQSDGSTTSLHRFIFKHVFQGVGSPAFASLLFALAYVAVCFIPNWVLYTKKIFLKV
jgi:predicted acyltransferase